MRIVVWPCDISVTPTGDQLLTTTLFLLRHAKSSWADPGADDHERTLQDKGRERATELAGWMEDRALGCDLVLCSTAVRACQTLDLVLPALGEPEVRHAPEIYQTDANGLIELLKAVDDSIERVMVIGHDPVLQITATTLAMSATGDAMDRLKRKYPTSALAMLTFGAAGWASLGPGVGHLELFFVPGQDG
ncbi:MAG: phosphohistidine phosphatase [Rhodospirillaceae bacterium]|nr:phosphohistidine phosphatase [Rhodospirillaceae bacterium]